MRILIAEDDKVSREYLFRLVSPYSECDMTANGIEAVDAFIIALDENRPYDIIFLDIMMPIYDGSKVLKTIRNIEKKRKIERNKRVKVFITSALNDKELISRLSEDGFEAYLIKPLNINELLAIVEAYIKNGN